MGISKPTCVFAVFISILPTRFEKEDSVAFDTLTEIWPANGPVLNNSEVNILVIPRVVCRSKEGKDLPKRTTNNEKKKKKNKEGIIAEQETFS